MLISEEQKVLILENVPNGNELISNNDLGELLSALDDTIIDKGMDKDYSLNDIGVKLQLAYDQIYNQN